MHSFAGPPAPTLSLLWPALPGAALVALVRLFFLRSIGHIAKQLAKQLHGTQWSSQLKPHAAEDFAERIFYASSHTLCTVVGGIICWSNGWLTKSGEFFFAMPFPHALPPAQAALTRAYFSLEAAFALESSFHLVRIVVRDGAARERMMLLHHAVTLLLISASWAVIGLPETGAVVLWLHAASDIFIDLLKACDALKWDALLVPCYVLALIGWVGFRFILLPYHLLRPGWGQISANAAGKCGPYPDCGPFGLKAPEQVYGGLCWFGLVLLLVMHATWLKQLLRKGMSHLFKTAASAELPDMCAPGFVGVPTAKGKQE